MNLPGAQMNSTIGNSVERLDGDPFSPAVWQRRIRLASLGVIVVSLIGLIRILPVGRLVELLSAQVESLGIWGPAAFVVIYVMAAILFVPGSALTLAAGAVFGLMAGTLVVSLASTTAAAFAFLIGRHLARDTVHQWASRNPRFGAFDRAIGAQGLKIIALLRLSPAVPFSLGNYLFGTTSIRFWPYVVTSWLAMLPGTFMYVYLGHAGRAGLAAATGGNESRTAGQWVLMIVGLAATLAVTIYITRLARNAIKDDADISGASGAPEDGTTSVKAAKPNVLPTVLTAVFALALAGFAAYAYLNRAIITGLFGPPAVTLRETYADKPDGVGFDHSPFDAILKQYVNDAGLVNYRALKENSADLDTYITALAQAPLNNMGRNERLALLINAYNAFTLRLILDHYPLKSIKDIPSDQRWDAKRWNLGGNIWSLNQIEHEQVRPNFKEPRIHFVLVCAAVGCPPLRNEAYAAKSLEQQLDAQANYVHAHERWFQFDPPANIVKLTSLYDWYGSDFIQVGGSVLDYAARHSPKLKNTLDEGGRPKVEFLDYDWSLNDRENP